MARMHKLTKGGQTIYPATITDAVVNPNSRKSLTAELSELGVQTNGIILFQNVALKGYYSTDKGVYTPSDSFICTPKIKKEIGKSFSFYKDDSIYTPYSVIVWGNNSFRRLTNISSIELGEGDIAFAINESSVNDNSNIYIRCDDIYNKINSSIASVNNAIEEIHEDIYETKKDEVLVSSSHTIENKIVDVNGNLVDTSNSTYFVKVYNVSRNGIRAKISNIFSNSQRSVISAWKDGVYMCTLLVGGPTVTTGQIFEFYLPEGCNQIYASAVSQLYDVAITSINKIQNLDVRIEKNSLDIQNIFSHIIFKEDIDITESYYEKILGWINYANGSFNSSTKQEICKYNVNEGYTYHVICYPSGTSVSGVTYYNDDSFISSDKNAIGTSNGEKRELDITIPEGVNQLYICGLIGKNLVYNVKHEYINAEKLQKDIEEIRQKLNLTKNGVSVLTGKTLVILGDSSCSVDNIENNTGEKTSWAYRAHELGNIYEFNVFIYAVSGSGWSKTPNSENVMYQWEQAKAQLQSINCEDPVIIITTGGNELNKLLLNYDEAIELCESDTTSLQNAGEYAVQTLKNILEDCPKASVYLVANFYAGSNIAKNRNRRIYRNFLNAMSDFFTCSLIDLSKNAQIRGYQENDVNSNGYHLFTSDGIHAYNIDGQKRICRIILGRLVADFTIEFLE